MTDLRTLSRGYDVEQYVNRSNTATTGLGTMGGLTSIAASGGVDPVTVAGGFIAGACCLTLCRRVFNPKRLPTGSAKPQRRRLRAVPGLAAQRCSDSKR